MRSWNVINSCKSKIISYKKDVNSVNTSDVSSQINISIKQNQIDNELSAVSSLLVNPNSKNANYARSCTRSVKSLTDDITALNNKHKAANSDGNVSTNRSLVSTMPHRPANLTIDNSRINTIIMKHNRSIINSANNKKSTAASSGNIYQTSSRSNSVHKNLISSSNLSNKSSNYITNKDINNIYYQEMNKLNNITNVSKHNDKMYDINNHHYHHASHYLDNNDIDSSNIDNTKHISNILDFNKINNKNENYKPAKNIDGSASKVKNNELHGLEHHVQAMQKKGLVSRYLGNFTIVIMVVIICCCIIGIVGYASTLF